ncbi:YppE family protein [Bacillus piscicola]|uniref:YppE family protein n=1 Tax=Bacillus piscicola TaxID=1632684 RepID=UPI001F08FA57|nr:YppE family protein [Bacillus piscicola]
MDKHLLYEKTKELQALNQEALAVFIRLSENEEDAPDFYEEVKPFADKVKDTADEWKPLAEEWVVEEKPQYFYLKQIDDTHENLLISSILAFQPDTKKKRFREMIQSIDYIMSGIENALTRE